MSHKSPTTTACKAAHKLNETLWRGFLHELESKTRSPSTANSRLISAPSSSILNDSVIDVGVTNIESDEEVEALGAWPSRSLEMFNGGQKGTNDADVVVLSSDSENENDNSIWNNKKKAKYYQQIWEKTRYLVFHRLIPSYTWARVKDLSSSRNVIEDGSLFPYLKLQALSDEIKKFIKEHSLNSKELKFLWINVIQWILAIKASSDQLDLNCDERFNLILVDFMVQYVNYNLHIYCHINNNDEILTKVNQIMQTLSVVFNGNNMHSLMVLLKVEMTEKYRNILEPIFRKHLTDRSLGFMSDDFVVYLRLIFCFRRWKLITPLKTDREKINEIAVGKPIRDSKQRLERSKSSTINEQQFESILPKAVPKLNIQNQSFISISDLIGHAIERKAIGTRILLVFNSLNLDEAIVKYFRLYEKYISRKTAIVSSTQLSCKSLHATEKFLCNRVVLGNYSIPRNVQEQSCELTRQLQSSKHRQQRLDGEKSLSKTHLGTIRDSNNKLHNRHKLNNKTQSDISCNSNNLDIIELDSTDDENNDASINLLNHVIQRQQNPTQNKNRLGIESYRLKITDSSRNQNDLTELNIKSQNVNRSDNTVILNLTSEDENESVEIVSKPRDKILNESHHKISKIANQNYISTKNTNQAKSQSITNISRTTMPSRKEEQCILGEVSSTTSLDNMGDEQETQMENSNNETKSSRSDLLEVHSAGIYRNAREVGTVRAVDQRMSQCQKVVGGTHKPENEDDDRSLLVVVEEATSSTEVFSRAQLVEKRIFSTLHQKTTESAGNTNVLHSPMEKCQNSPKDLRNDLPTCSRYTLNSKNTQSESTLNIPRNENDDHRVLNEIQTERSIIECVSKEIENDTISVPIQSDNTVHHNELNVEDVYRDINKKENYLEIANESVIPKTCEISKSKKQQSDSDLPNICEKCEVSSNDDDYSVNVSIFSKNNIVNIAATNPQININTSEFNILKNTSKVDIGDSMTNNEFSTNINLQLNCNLKIQTLKDVSTTNPEVYKTQCINGAHQNNMLQYTNMEKESHKINLESMPLESIEHNNTSRNNIVNEKSTQNSVKDTNDFKNENDSIIQKVQDNIIDEILDNQITDVISNEGSKCPELLIKNSSSNHITKKILQTDNKDCENENNIDHNKEDNINELLDVTVEIPKLHIINITNISKDVNELANDEQILHSEHEHSDANATIGKTVENKNEKSNEINTETNSSIENNEIAKASESHECKENIENVVISNDIEIQKCQLTVPNTSNEHLQQFDEPTGDCNGPKPEQELDTNKLFDSNKGNRDDAKENDVDIITNKASQIVKLPFNEDGGSRATGGRTAHNNNNKLLAQDNDAKDNDILEIENNVLNENIEKRTPLKIRIKRRISQCSDISNEMNKPEPENTNDTASHGVPMCEKTAKEKYAIKKTLDAIMCNTLEVNSSDEKELDNKSSLIIDTSQCHMNSKGGRRKKQKSIKISIVNNSEIVDSEKLTESNTSTECLQQHMPPNYNSEDILAVTTLLNMQNNVTKNNDKNLENHNKFYNAQQTLTLKPAIRNEGSAKKSTRLEDKEVIIADNIKKDKNTNEKYSKRLHEKSGNKYDKQRLDDNQEEVKNDHLKINDESNKTKSTNVECHKAKIFPIRLTATSSKRVKRVTFEDEIREILPHTQTRKTCETIELKRDLIDKDQITGTVINNETKLTKSILTNHKRTKSELSCIAESEYIELLQNNFSQNTIHNNSSERKIKEPRVKVKRLKFPCQPITSQREEEFPVPIDTIKIEDLIEKNRNKSILSNNLCHSPTTKKNKMCKEIILRPSEVILTEDIVNNQAKVQKVVEAAQCNSSTCKQDKNMIYNRNDKKQLNVLKETNDEQNECFVTQNVEEINIKSSNIEICEMNKTIQSSLTQDKITRQQTEDSVPFNKCSEVILTEDIVNNQAKVQKVVEAAQCNSSTCKQDKNMIYNQNDKKQLNVLKETNDEQNGCFVTQNVEEINIKSSNIEICEMNKTIQSSLTQDKITRQQTEDSVPFNKCSKFDIEETDDKIIEVVVAELKLLSPESVKTQPEQNETNKQIQNKSVDANVDVKDHIQQKLYQEQITAELLNTSIETVLGNTNSNNRNSINATNSENNEINSPCDSENKLAEKLYNPLKGRIDILTAEKINSTYENNQKNLYSEINKIECNHSDILRNIKTETNTISTKVRMGDEKSKKTINKSQLNDVKIVPVNVPEVLFADEESENSNSDEMPAASELSMLSLGFETLNDTDNYQSVNATDMSKRQCLATPNFTVHKEPTSSKKIDIITEKNKSKELSTCNPDDLNKSFEETGPNVADSPTLGVPLYDPFDVMLSDQYQQTFNCTISGKRAQNSYNKLIDKECSSIKHLGRESTPNAELSERKYIECVQSNSNILNIEEGNFLRDLNALSEVEESNAIAFPLVDDYWDEGGDFFPFPELDKTQSRCNSFSNDSDSGTERSETHGEISLPKENVSQQKTTAVCDHSYNKDIGDVIKNNNVSPVKYQPSDVGKNQPRNPNPTKCNTSPTNETMSSSNASASHKQSPSSTTDTILNASTKLKSYPTPYWKMKRSNNEKSPTSRRKEFDSIDENVQSVSEVVRNKPNVSTTIENVNATLDDNKAVTYNMPELLIDPAPLQPTLVLTCQSKTKYSNETKFLFEEKPMSSAKDNVLENVETDKTTKLANYKETAQTQSESNENRSEQTDQIAVDTKVPSTLSTSFQSIIRIQSQTNRLERVDTVINQQCVDFTLRPTEQFNSLPKYNTDVPFGENVVRQGRESTPTLDEPSKDVEDEVNTTSFSTVTPSSTRKHEATNELEEPPRKKPLIESISTPLTTNEIFDLLKNEEKVKKGTWKLNDIVLDKKSDNIEEKQIENEGKTINRLEEIRSNEAGIDPKVKCNSPSNSTLHSKESKKEIVNKQTKQSISKSYLINDCRITRFSESKCTTDNSSVLKNKIQVMQCLTVDRNKSLPPKVQKKTNDAWKNESGDKNSACQALPTTQPYPKLHSQNKSTTDNSSVLKNKLQVKHCLTPDHNKALPPKAQKKTNDLSKNEPDQISSAQLKKSASESLSTNQTCTKMPYATQTPNRYQPYQKTNEPSKTTNNKVFVGSNKYYKSNTATTHIQKVTVNESIGSTNKPNYKLPDLHKHTQSNHSPSVFSIDVNNIELPDEVKRSIAKKLEEYRCTLPFEKNYGIYNNNKRLVELQERRLRLEYLEEKNRIQVKSLSVEVQQIEKANHHNQHQQHHRQKNEYKFSDIGTHIDNQVETRSVTHNVSRTRAKGPLTIPTAWEPKPASVDEIIEDFLSKRRKT